VPHVLVAKRERCALIIAGRWQVVSPSPASYIRLKCSLRLPVRPSKPPRTKLPADFRRSLNNGWRRARRLF